MNTAPRAAGAPPSGGDSSTAYCARIAAQDSALTADERDALSRLTALEGLVVHERNRAALARLIDPLDAVSSNWGTALTISARNLLLMQMSRYPVAYWAWNEQAWARFLLTSTDGDRRRRRSHLVAWAYLFGGHRRLHRRIGIAKLGPLADFVFGAGAVESALTEVSTLLKQWNAGPVSQPELVRSAVLDALLSAGSEHLTAVTLPLLEGLVADTPASSAREAGCSSCPAC